MRLLYSVTVVEKTAYMKGGCIIIIIIIIMIIIKKTNTLRKSYGF